MNPIVEIRGRLGLSEKDLCIACRLRRDVIYHVEAGLIPKPPDKVLAFLERAGFPRESIIRDFEEYRRQSAAEVESRIQQA